MSWPVPGTHPDFYDPLLWKGRHPILPAGVDADPIDGDAYDGSGTNWPVWPEVFDSYFGCTPILMTTNQTDVLDGKPDVVVQHENNRIGIEREVRVQPIRRRA